MEFIIKKLLVFLLLTSYCVSVSVGIGAMNGAMMNSKTGFGSFKNKKHTTMKKKVHELSRLASKAIRPNEYAPRNMTKDDLPSGIPIYYKGWVKFFDYLRTPEKPDKPTFLFRNEQFGIKTFGNSTEPTKPDEVNYLIFFYLFSLILFLVWTNGNSRKDFLLVSCLRRQN
jgi:hypothetical protein